MNKKNKLIELYYEENVDREKDPYYTGLSFKLTDGRIIKQYSTDIVLPYGEEKEKQLSNCIECGEEVPEREAVTNCHSSCRLEL